MQGRVLAWGGALALVISMSACNTPGTAGEVEGHKVTTSQVASATHAYNSLVSTLPADRRPKPIPESLVASVLLRGEGARVLGDRAGQPIDGAAEAMLSDPDLAPFVKDQNVRPLFLALTRTEVVSRAMGGEDQFEQALGSVKVTTNPRYGLPGLQQIPADPQSGQLMTRSGSLSNLAHR